MEASQFEICFVPAHDSPKNILNILNDDCIQVILRKLTNIRDFSSASKTCKRFQENAKQCFPRHLREVTIKNDRNWDLRNLPTKRALSFLNIFGHSIRSLNLSHYRVLKFTRQYCSKTLTELDLCRINKNINLSKFQSLRELKIRGCSVNKLYLPTNLKVLKLNNVKLEHDRIEWNPNQEFPELEVVEFCGVNLNDTELITFLSLTLRLQRLKIIACDKLIPHYDDPSHIFAAIGNLVSNLVELEIRPSFRWLKDYENRYYDIDWAPMLQLQRLKCFHLYGPGSIDQLIELFAEHAVPIEELAFEVRYFYTENVPNLLKLKQLKKLIIRIDEIFLSDDFVQMAKDLPALAEIEFKTRTITPQQILEALEYGKNLSKVNILTNYFDMNESEFYSIWHQLTKCYLRIIALRGDINYPDCTGFIHYPDYTPSGHYPESTDFGYEDERICIETGKFVCQRIRESDLTSEE